jgi:hypothetical protein
MRESGPGALSHGRFKDPCLQTAHRPYDIESGPGWLSREVDSLAKHPETTLLNTKPCETVRCVSLLTHGAHGRYAQFQSQVSKRGMMGLSNAGMEHLQDCSGRLGLVYRELQDLRFILSKCVSRYSPSLGCVPWDVATSSAVAPPTPLR